MLRLTRVPRGSRLFIKIAFADALATGIFTGAVMPFCGVVARRLGASAELLVIMSMAQFAGFLLSFFSTRIASRMPWGRMLLLLRIVSWAPLLLLFKTQSPLGFVLLISIGHMFGAVAHAFFHAVFRDSVRERFRAGAMTFQRVSSLLLALPLAWLAGRMLDRDVMNFQILFPVCAAAGLLLALPFKWLPSGRGQAHVGRHPPRINEELRVFLNDRPFRAFMLAFFVGTLGEKIGMPVIPIYFTDVLDLSYEQVGLALGVAGPLLAMGGYVFWGLLSRRVDPLTITAWAMLLKALRPALWATAARWEHPELVIIAGEGVFRWMIAGIEMGAVLSVLRFSPPTAAPLYVGIHFILMGVRGLAGPIIGWALYRAGVPLHAILWIIAAIVFAGGIKLFHLRRSVLSENRPDAQGIIDI